MSDSGSWGLLLLTVMVRTRSAMSVNAFLNLYPFYSHMKVKLEALKRVDNSDGLLSYIQFCVMSWIKISIGILCRICQGTILLTSLNSFQSFWGDFESKNFKNSIHKICPQIDLIIMLNTLTSSKFG